MSLRLDWQMIPLSFEITEGRFRPGQNRDLNTLFKLMLFERLKIS